jgi:uncharacterized membrane protein
MGFFSKFGEIIIRFFSLIGDLILEIPKIPERLKNVDQDRIKEKIDPDKLKDGFKSINAEKIKDGLSYSKTAEGTEAEELIESKSYSKDDGAIFISTQFTSKEKEDTIFRLQLLSISFLILSILYVFNFLNLVLFLLLAIVIAAVIFYFLYNKIRLMYGSDFAAYRDFFLMYLAVGIILVFVGNNSNFMMAFSFQFLPSLTVLIFAVISVLALFLIFRIRYSRDYTYGEVVDIGKKTAHVKIDYDIRSNVKPDIYIVDNSYGAQEGDQVIVKVDEKIFSTDGNKPISILESITKI